MGKPALKTLNSDWQRAIFQTFRSRSKFSYLLCPLDPSSLLAEEKRSTSWCLQSHHFRIIRSISKGWLVLAKQYSWFYLLLCPLHQIPLQEAKSSFCANKLVNWSTAEGDKNNLRAEQNLPEYFSLAWIWPISWQISRYKLL